MENILKVGILRETKIPPDRRVPLTPPQITALGELYPSVKFYIQPSDSRAYSNEEYVNLNVILAEDISHCDILMGIKEVNISTVIENKTYILFPHVAKQQAHNRLLFKELARKKATIIDYEYLTDENSQRLVAFGRYAGIVGAFNALRAYGTKTNRFSLKPAHQCRDVNEMWAGLSSVNLPGGLKILITGKGRVSSGATETLNKCNVVQVNPEDYLTHIFDVPVFCQIGPDFYTKHNMGNEFVFKHYLENPAEYSPDFLRFASLTDILITGHYWSPSFPIFFTREQMKDPAFRISIIADVTCDLNGPIPSTLRTSTIPDPFYSYNKQTGKEEPPFSNPENIIVMSVDNLPGELPRDASHDFGNQLIQHIMPDLLTGNSTPMLERATILYNGKLTPRFAYLENYLNG